MAHDTLYAIGEALIDMIPSKTGCSFAKVPSFSPRVGGAPANVCGAYARLGGDSSLLTQLGDDPFGHKIVDDTRKRRRTAKQRSDLSNRSIP